MKHLRSHLIGIDQGSVTLFSEFEDGGEMWTGHGPRERRRTVAFDQPYRKSPAVQVTLSLLDSDSGSNTRAEVQAENITKAGFDAVFRTWGDSRVARVRVTWTAIGEMKNADDWDLR